MKRTLGALLTLMPGAAEACAVCGAAADRDKNAFLGTTILLSLLPLALIGACLWWLNRQARGQRAVAFAESERVAMASGSLGEGGRVRSVTATGVAGGDVQPT